MKKADRKDTLPTVGYLFYKLSFAVSPHLNSNSISCLLFTFM